MNDRVFNSYITTLSNKSITVLTPTQTRIYDNTVHNYDTMVTLLHATIYSSYITINYIL